MNEVYRKFKGVKKCFVIEVLEGKGTTESVCELNSYVIDENGNLLGVFKNHEINKITNEYN